MAIDAFIANEETHSRVLDALKDRNVSKMQGHISDGGHAAAVQYYSEVPTPDVLIVEIEASGDELMAGLEALAEVCDPGTRVIVIGSENDVGLYRSLIKMGISDYLAAPVTSGQMFDAIHSLVADPDAQPSGKVFAFIGAHGGVGSSTVAHNVAWSIAPLRTMLPGALQKYAILTLLCWISICSSALPRCRSTSKPGRVSMTVCRSPTGSTSNFLIDSWCPTKRTLKFWALQDP